MRPLESEELAGFRDAMVELSTEADLSDYKGMDIVGTGGDGKNTFNISTLACFIVAGTGVNITKHGNYAATSNSGASNVLEFLGYEFSNDINKLKADLEKGNFCFLHAPLFHPAMKNIAPVRRALKVPTFFNILGPMINPSKPSVITSYSIHYTKLYDANARVTTRLADLGTVTVAGRRQTSGFGSIDAGINDRSIDDINAIDVTASVDWGRFFPEKAGIRIPMYYGYSNSTTNPKYNPLDPDIEMTDALSNLETKSERDSLKHLAQEVVERIV